MLTAKNHDVMEIRSMDTVDLKNELAKTLTITADYLMYIAAIWQELELRGEDLSHLRHGMMSYIPLIATRQLDAHFVVNYAGQKTLLSHIARLPMPMQKALIDKQDEVEVAGIDQNGEILTKKIHLAELSATQISQVFGEGKIKEVDKQYNLLLARQAIKAKNTPKKGYRMTQKIKIEDGNLIVSGKYGVNIEQLLPLLLSYIDSKK